MKQRLLSLLAVFVSTSAALAVTPAGVPEGYVVTPFGYYHSSCVRQLAEGDVLKSDELVIQHADGALDGMRACAYPHYTASGEAIAADAKDPSIEHSWIDGAYAETKTSYGGLITKWTVPPAPKSHDGQTIYFFPGLEDYDGVKTIIQPVLGWNAYYKNEWGIASWNCCTKGTVYVSTPQPAKAGDAILGGMYDNCKAGTLECSSWDVITEDVASHKTTKLTNTSNFKQTFNWGFATVLEVYNVVRCSDYPPTDRLTSSEIALYNDQFKQVSPNWVPFVFDKVTPQCGYGASGNETKITITY